MDLRETEKIDYKELCSLKTYKVLFLLDFMKIAPYVDKLLTSDKYKDFMEEV